MYSDGRYLQLWCEFDEKILIQHCCMTVQYFFHIFYSIVYSLVCKGYGSLLYEDLVYKKIDAFIGRLNESLNTLKVRTLWCVLGKHIIHECCWLYIPCITSVCDMFKSVNSRISHFGCWLLANMLTNALIEHTRGNVIYFDSDGKIYIKVSSNFICFAERESQRIHWTVWRSSTTFQ